MKSNPGAFTAISLVLGACGGALASDPDQAGGSPGQPGLQGGLSASGDAPVPGGGTATSAPSTGASDPGAGVAHGGAPALGGALATGGVPALGGAMPRGGVRAVGGAASGGVAQAGGRLSSGGTPAMGGWSSCADVVAELEPAPSVLMFLIDRSSSMDQDAYPNDDTRNSSKWVELQATLVRALGTLPATWGVGYASRPYLTDHCDGGVVGIAPLSTRIPLIPYTMSLTPSGFRATPRGWGDALSALEDPQYFTYDHYDHAPRSIVLITDGLPNVGSDCTGLQVPFLSPSDYASWMDTVASQGQAAGVRTFVIGLLGSQDPMATSYDPLYMLSQLAVAGGTAPPGCTPSPGTSTGTDVSPRGTYCHYDTTDSPDFGTAVEAALQQIRRQATSCSYPVPPPPPGMVADPANVTISYSADGITRILVKASSESCVDGQWYVSESDVNGCLTEIELCPTVCEMVKVSTEPAVFGTYRCMAIL